MLVHLLRSLKNMTAVSLDYVWSRRAGVEHVDLPARLQHLVEMTSEEILENCVS
jgi:hypothetical protein